MRSYDAAFRAGSSLGRTLPNPEISERELRYEIARRIAPDFRPARTVAEAKAASWTNAFSAVTCCGSIYTFLVILLNFREALPDQTQDLTDAVLAKVGIGTFNTFVVFFILICVALGIVASRKRKRAREVHRTAKLRLADAALAGATSALTRRRGHGTPSPSPHQGFEQVGRGPANASAPLGQDVDHLEAERVACRWMQSMGETSAHLTAVTGDGGIDVEGFFYIAQVKHFAARVGPGPVREMVGVARTDPRGRRPLFFTKTGYTSGAVDLANRAGVGLFIYDTYRGTLTGANDLGRRYRQFGLK